MARGRKGQSAEVIAAKGNPGKRKATKTAKQQGVELAPIAEARHPNLSKDAKRVWDLIAPRLRTMKFLRTTDTESLARWCEYIADFWNVTRTLRRKKSRTYETNSAHGRLRRIEPDFMVQGMLEKRLIVLEDRLGMSPRARQEILRSLSLAPLGGLPLENPSPDPTVDAPAVPNNPVGLLNRSSDRLH